MVPMKKPSAAMQTSVEGDGEITSTLVQTKATKKLSVAEASTPMDLPTAVQTKAMKKPSAAEVFTPEQSFEAIQTDQSDEDVVSPAVVTKAMKKPSAAEVFTPAPSPEALETEQSDEDVVSPAVVTKAMKKPAAAEVSTSGQSPVAKQTRARSDERVVSAAAERKPMKKPSAADVFMQTDGDSEGEGISSAAEMKAMKKPSAMQTKRLSKKKSMLVTPSKKVKRPSEESGEHADALELAGTANPHPDSFRKRPMSPVFAFINERRDEIAALLGAKNGAQISKKGTELFKALSPAEQEQRQNRFQEEMKAYKVWQATDEGKAVMMAKRSALKDKRAAKKEMTQRKLGRGSFAVASAQKRKASMILTPPKVHRVLNDMEKEGQAVKRLNKTHARLRKDVLGAVTSRERALAIAREAIWKGTIKPSWVGASVSTSKSQPLVEPSQQ